MAFRGTLVDIRLFVAAYEERSFTAAATREFSTQSGVSHHMRQLEETLGVKLFVRDKGGVVATPAADAYYKHCVTLLRSLDIATDEVARFATGFQASFVVGMIPALSNRICGPALLRFAERHPNVKVRIVESYSSSTADLVASGAVDLAITTLHGGETGVRGRALMTAPECVLSRHGSRVEPGKPINMVWASRMDARRRAITASLAANGITLEREIEIDSGLAMLDFVSRSDWKTVTPAFMIDPVADAGRFEFWPLLAPEVNFTIVVVEKTNSVLPVEAQEFVALIHEEADRATRHWVEHFKQT